MKPRSGYQSSTSRLSEISTSGKRSSLAMWHGRVLKSVSCPETLTIDRMRMYLRTHDVWSLSTFCSLACGNLDIFLKCSRHRPSLPSRAPRPCTSDISNIQPHDTPATTPVILYQYIIPYAVLSNWYQLIHSSSRPIRVRPWPGRNALAQKNPKLHRPPILILL